MDELEEGLKRQDKELCTGSEEKGRKRSTQ